MEKIYTDDLAIIDKKIEKLINDTNIYNFDTLKQEIIKILDGIEKKSTFELN